MRWPAAVGQPRTRTDELDWTSTWYSCLNSQYCAFRSLGQTKDPCRYLGSRYFFDGSDLVYKKFADSLKSFIKGMLKVKIREVWIQIKKRTAKKVILQNLNKFIEQSVTNTVFSSLLATSHRS